MSEDKSESENELEESNLSVRFENLEEELGKGKALPPAFRFLEKYFPEKDDMAQKGRLNDRRLTTDMSTIQILTKLFPELTEGKEEMDVALDEWLDALEKRMVSIEGQSREEYRSILEALLSGLRQTGEESGNSRKSIMRKLFTTGSEEGGGG